jgi:hypothetical protein
MQLATYRYLKDKGWDFPLDSRLDSNSTWVLIFGASDTSKLLAGFDDLRTCFPSSIWIGCSSAGEIHNRTLEDDSLVVAVMKFDKSTLKLATHPILAATESDEAGTRLAESLSAPDLRAVFVLSDGLSVNGSQLVKAISSGLADGVVISGGLAGDGDRFQTTWILVDKEPVAHYVTAVGIYGNSVRVAHGSKGGWDVLGPERTVTHSVGNVLYSLDDRPALELYEQYLGDRSAGMPATGLLFPLAIRNDERDGDPTVRTILAIDRAENSITFAGDIPQGSLVRLMHANFDRLVDGASRAAEQVALTDYSSGPLLAVAVSCVGRRLVLGQRTEEEIDAVLDSLPQGCELVGYYSYGELSPMASGRCELKNQTMTLSLIWEL